MAAHSAYRPNNIPVCRLRTSQHLATSKTRGHRVGAVDRVAQVGEVLTHDVTQRGMFSLDMFVYVILRQQELVVMFGWFVHCTSQELWRS